MSSEITLRYFTINRHARLFVLVANEPWVAVDGCTEAANWAYSVNIAGLLSVAEDAVVAWVIEAIAVDKEEFGTIRVSKIKSARKHP